MPAGVVRSQIALRLVLLMLPALVYCMPLESSALAQAQKGKAKEAARSLAVAQPPPAPAAATLPPPVAEMREAIMSAVRAGRIEELKTAIEWNELKPEFAGKAVDDPIAYLKQQSGDGEGREILAILGNLLDGGYAIVPMGKDLENNRIYVWPALAEIPFASFTPAHEVDLLRLVPPPVAMEMKAKGKYTFWRLMIGADGTWHSFSRQE